MSALFTLLLFVAWAALVAFCDCRNRRIPNSVIVIGLIAAFACALLRHSPFDVSMKQAALGAVIGLVALLPFYAFGVMGAADVKVFAALGAWCGVHALLDLWVIATIIAGAHALWLLIATRTRVAALVRRRAPTFELAGRRSTPFAACLTVPAIVWLATQAVAGGLR
ncbi:A24 family peptidase [Paraburkholderia megapolitana]|uniref:Prepilin peptidase CpaA n=1 Tax=Paraburkholderia megapolitana TaxID=420953 RepID=A0A1I3R9A5_9BURK|nr:prepilin peptidase [Paraburkholderia megapolitana]QDQ83722.1 prepilin peptidase [Paraburkholderia megapolitana]SFJ41927.1 prepilin peptidase CpaA [Paraburkholderia megapolitana]